MNTIGGKSIIRMVYENALHTGLFDEVVVITDSEIIYNEISLHGGLVKMSVGNHNSGSDRIAEVAANMDVDVVVNIQGDEPLVDFRQLDALVEAFNDETVAIATLG